MSYLKTIRLTPADIVIITIQWSMLLVIRIILIIIGLVIVPMALPFRKHHLDTRKNFTEHNRTKFWELVTLPKWAWIWSNDRDGALGDKRGWWDKECGDSRSFSCMFKWLALRNPAHNTTFTALSSNVCKSAVVCIGGLLEQDFKDIDDGWQLLKTAGSRIPRYHLYIVKPKIGLYVNIGHKIKLKHNNHQIFDHTAKCWKKFTFRVRVGR